MGRNGHRNEGGSRGDATPLEEDAEFLQGALNALFGRAFAAVQGGADFFHAFAVKKAQHDGLAITGAQGGQGAIEQGRHLLPGFVGLALGEVNLHSGLFMSAGAANFASEKSDGRQVGAFEQPTGKGAVLEQGTRLARQDDENRLRDFLGVMRVPGVAHGDRVDLVDMARDQRGKSFFGAELHIRAQQGAVIPILHSPTNAAEGTKGTAFFGGQV